MRESRALAARCCASSSSPDSVDNMQNGIYRLRGRIGHESEIGVAMIENNEIRGLGKIHVYVGERVSVYGKQGWKILGRRYAPVTGAGLDGFEVNVFGEENETHFTLRGEVTSFGIEAVTLSGERLSDL
jgi:hypothetical protein